MQVAGIRHTGDISHRKDRLMWKAGCDETSLSRVYYRGLSGEGGIQSKDAYGRECGAATGPCNSNTPCLDGPKKT